MNQHKRRLDRLDFHLPSGDDDEILVIRLTWPEQEPVKPAIVRRGAGGQKAGGKIAICWPDAAAEVV